MQNDTARTVHERRARTRLACARAVTSVRSWWILAAVTATALAALGLAGCSTNNEVGALDGSVVRTFDAAGGAACGKAGPGCACAISGEIATCTEYEQRSGN